MPTVQTLIMQDKLKPVLEFLATKADSYDNNSIIMLQARLNRLSNNLSQGIINSENAGLEQNRIRLGVSNLAEQMGWLQAELSTDGSSSSTSSSSNTKDKKQLLFLCSSPKGAATLDFSSELGTIDQMRQIGQKRDQFAEPTIKTQVLARQFLKLLSNYNPNILHISLHSSKKRGLYFENLSGAPDPVGVEEFKDYMALYQNDISKDNPIDLVILSACNSFDHGKAIQGLVKNVVCMNDFIPDEASVHYAYGFYSSLFDGNEPSLAHKMAVMQLKHEKFEGVEDVYKIPQFLN
jgi:CHAT domain-containing protein